jgi:hypothetical protein
MFASRPSRDDFDKELTWILREAISNTRVTKNGDPLDNLTALGCRLSTEHCLQVLKNIYGVTNSNFLLFSRHVVRGPGANISCFGVIKQFVCPTIEVSVPALTNALRPYF